MLLEGGMFYFNPKHLFFEPGSCVAYLNEFACELQYEIFEDQGEHWISRNDWTRMLSHVEKMRIRGKRLLYLASGWNFVWAAGEAGRIFDRGFYCEARGSAVDLPGRGGTGERMGADGESDAGSGVGTPSCQNPFTAERKRIWGFLFYVLAGGAEKMVSLPVLYSDGCRGRGRLAPCDLPARRKGRSQFHERSGKGAPAGRWRSVMGCIYSVRTA